MLEFLFMLSFFALIVGLIALIKGNLTKLKINDRKIAGIVVVVAFVLMTIFVPETENGERPIAEKKEQKEEKEIEETKEEEPKTQVEKEKKEETKEVEEKEKKVTEEIESPEDLEEYAKWVIENEIGLETNRNDYPERIKEINIAADSVVLHLVSNDNLTTNMIKGGIKKDSEDLLKSLFDNEDVEIVDLVWYAPLVDEYGQEELGEVLNINMWRDTYEKINWDNFLREDFNRVSDAYWEHQAFSD